MVAARILPLRRSRIASSTGSPGNARAAWPPAGVSAGQPACGQVVELPVLEPDPEDPEDPEDPADADEPPPDDDPEPEEPDDPEVLEVLGDGGDVAVVTDAGTPGISDPGERLVRAVLDAGYEGAFDLEILGPRIEEEGYRAPIARSLDRAGEILDRLGA